MATEDHDLDEIRHATWFEQGKLIRFELPLIAETGRPVGRIPLGAEVAPFVQEAAGLLANQGSDLLAHIWWKATGRRKPTAARSASYSRACFSSRG